ncbi:hypothetical protein [Olleya namhaensis]|uniref:Uncharacterized protein n=1 Tax=Olleya namhaensis TaxID=1144750 RepID=A0A1I3KNY8_9FLAO|nr:hypothetical protein [Olleya namhaensis]SFI74233.1 hypothetical protein SAMN05443431_10261 [Olleya namhaensis]
MIKTIKILASVLISILFLNGCSVKEEQLEDIQTDNALESKTTTDRTSIENRTNSTSYTNTKYIVNPSDHFFRIRFKPNTTKSQKEDIKANIALTFTDIEIMVNKADYFIIKYVNSDLTTIISYINNNFQTITETPDQIEDHITVVKINYLIEKTELQKTVIRNDFDNGITKFLVEIKNFEYTGFEYAPGTTPPDNDTELWFARGCCVSNEIDIKIGLFYNSVLQNNTIQ